MLTQKAGRQISGALDRAVRASAQIATRRVSGRTHIARESDVRYRFKTVFVAVERKAGQRIVSVTERRGKVEFVAFIGGLLTGAYAKARRVHLVLDNLNTHFRTCFDDVLGQRSAKKLLRRVRFHYTPKHASWLNMAEIEIGVLSRQCLDRRIASRQLLVSEVEVWQQARNALQRTIAWKLTRQDADTKLGRYYASKLAC